MKKLLLLSLILLSSSGCVCCYKAWNPPSATPKRIVPLPPPTQEVKPTPIKQKPQNKIYKIT